jgi:hypothetical protein
MKYTVSLTLTVDLDIPEGDITDPNDSDIRTEAWKEFQRRYELGDYDSESIDVELEE